MTSLSERMKKYENISNHYLMFKTPVILRLDGKNFHSYTK
jgi:tRNA(His) 5'-end guanylyltransferase